MSRLGRGAFLIAFPILVAANHAIADPVEQPPSATSSSFPGAAVPTDKSDDEAATQAGKCKLSDISDLLPLQKPGTLPPQRQALIENAALCADSRDKSAPSYAGLLGFIYMSGNLLPNNATAIDMDKARHYLSIAAKSGDVLAMAELAELESALGDYEKAIVWTFIYDHYSTAKGWSDKSGYFPELLPRTYDKIDNATWKEVVAEGDAFIQQNDVAIQAALASVRRADEAPSEKLWVQRPGKFYFRATGYYFSISTIAMFLVAFDKDGNRVGAWLLGAVPSAKVATIFQDKVLDGRIVPRQDGKFGLRYSEYLSTTPTVFLRRILHRRSESSRH